MNLFRVAGIQLSVHVSFLLLLAYVGWQGWAAAGPFGLVWSLIYVLALFTCVTLHEFGHAVAARRFGVRVPRIVLLPIGGMAELESIPRRPRQEIIIALAGPAVNVLLIVVLMTFVRFPAGWNPAYLPVNIAELGRHLVLVNLVMGVFNLIPVFPMDGGRVLRAVLAMRRPYLRATQIAAGVGKVLAILGAAWLLYEGHYLGVALFLFIFAAGEMELRAVARAERVEAHWREVYARFRAVAPAAEPPIVNDEEPPRTLL